MTRRSWAAVAARDVVRRRYVVQAMRSVPYRAPATFVAAFTAGAFAYDIRLRWRAAGLPGPVRLEWEDVLADAGK